MDEGPKLSKAIGLRKPALDIRLVLVEVLDPLDVLIAFTDDRHWDLPIVAGASPLAGSSTT
jgi:hypothetical protein